MYQDLQKYSTENHDWFSEYKWLKIYSIPWIHEKIFKEFLALNPKKNCRILILWSWTWALDQRIVDSWFTNITFSDFLSKNYKAKWTNFIQFDLNTEKWNFWVFDYIFAIEVIEHLENQFHFIRSVKKCLKKDWYLFLSTPNITNQYSKANFIVKWQLAHFAEINLNETWHICIIAPHILLYNIKKNWFKIIKKTDEEKFKLKFTTKNLRTILWYFIYKFLMIFLRWNKNQIDIFILKNII